MTQSMPSSVRLGERELNVSISPRAARQLALRESPLHIEMELYFSCLIRKRVNVGETGRRAFVSTALADNATISFRPVMTRHCAVSDVDGEPPVEDFPITAAERFIPHWLRLDYRRGRWEGDFGYSESPAPG
jgi:hypothetical protein